MDLGRHCCNRRIQNPWCWSEVGAGAFGANQQADTDGDVIQQAETKPAARKRATALEAVSHEGLQGAAEA